MQVTIRKAEGSDIDAMYDISTSVHLSPLYHRLIPADQYSRFFDHYTRTPEGKEKYFHTMKDRLKDPSWEVWVAEYEGKVCGFRLVHLLADYSKLQGLFVSIEQQGKGVGAKLFSTWTKYKQRGVPCVLEVVDGNHRAISLYEAAGFLSDGYAAKKFYGAKQLRMIKY